LKSKSQEILKFISCSKILLKKLFIKSNQRIFETLTFRQILLKKFSFIRKSLSFKMISLDGIFLRYREYIFKIETDFHINRNVVLDQKFCHSSLK
jgi:hypothetical protein